MTTLSNDCVANVFLQLVPGGLTVVSAWPISCHSPETCRRSSLLGGCETVKLSKACLGIPSIFFSFKTDLWPLHVNLRGDTTNTNLQNMEPVSETDEEQVPEDLGKLTVVDKARTGRVSLKNDLTSNGVKLCIPVFAPKHNCLQRPLLNCFGFYSNSFFARTTLIR